MDKDASTTPQEASGTDNVVNVPVSPLKAWLASIAVGAVLPLFAGPLPALPESITSISLLPSRDTADALSTISVMGGEFRLRLTTVVGAAVVFLGMRMQKHAKNLFKKEKTPPRHGHKIQHLITGGVFSLTRNPLYIATAIISGGIAMMLNSGWVLITYLPFWIYLNSMVVPREERTLENLFGDEYRKYKKRVPRWLF